MHSNESVCGRLGVSRQSVSVVAWLTVAMLGVGVFAAHALLYWTWLIDDAGISFAYARNVVAGHGFVAQAGATPVEGFSNPTWVAIMVVLARLGVLSLPLAPKLVAGVCIAACYALVISMIGRASVRPVTTSACTLLASSLNPSMVVWSVSGLENSLYLLGIVLLAHETLRALTPSANDRAFASSGAVAAFVAITRPNGILFAIAPLAVAGLVGSRPKRRSLAVYGAVFGGLFGAFLVARFVVFHRLLPNTAVAKGGPAGDDLVALVFLTKQGVAKLDGLLEGAFPEPLTNTLFMATVAAGWFVTRMGRSSPALATLAVFAFFALGDFMLMPADWARENRFGTAFYPLYYACVFVLTDLALECSIVRWRSVATAAVGLALVLFMVPDDVARARTYAHNVNIDLFFVQRAFAERFDRYAAELNVRDASVLLPDVGGMLLWSHLRVHDLAGLCDERIARLRAANPDGERNYVFGTMKPTFLHTYGRWSKIAHFEQDSRFASDYVPIHVYSKEEDPDQDGLTTGIFVRRDAVASPEAQRILEEFRREGHNRRDFVRPLGGPWSRLWNGSSAAP